VTHKRGKGTVGLMGYAVPEPESENLIDQVITLIASIPPEARLPTYRTLERYMSDNRRPDSRWGTSSYPRGKTPHRSSADEGYLAPLASSGGGERPICARELSGSPAPAGHRAAAPELGDDVDVGSSPGAGSPG
jgi:hypothetical protein